MCLAGHNAHGARAPVHVLQAQHSYLANPQTQDCLAEGHGIVPLAHGGRAVESGQEFLQLLIGHRPGKMSQSPVRDTGNGGHQRRPAPTLELEVTKKTPQGTGSYLNRAWLTAAGVFRQVSHHILGPQRLPAHGTPAKLGAKEFACIPESAVTGGLRQTARLTKMEMVRLECGIDESES